MPRQYLNRKAPKSHLLDPAQFPAASIGGASIGAGSVGTTQLQPGSVTPSLIQANSITDGQVAQGGIGTASLADGSVTTAKIATNAVGAAQLASFFRQGCKYQVAADQTLASGAAITFASKAFDNFAQVTGSNYQPGNNGVMNLTARVRLTGAAIVPGTSVRLVLMTGTTRVLQGPECGVFHDQSDQDVAIATLDEAASLLAGTNYFLMFEVLTNTPSGSTTGPSYGTATVRAASQADYVITSNNTHVFVPFAASYFQALPVAQ